MVPLMATDEEIEELDDELETEDDGESNEETHEVKDDIDEELEEELDDDGDDNDAYIAEIDAETFKSIFMEEESMELPIEKKNGIYNTCTMDSLAHNKCPVYWGVLIFKPIWYLQQCPLYTECPQ